MEYSNNRTHNVREAAKWSDLISTILEPYSFPKFDASIEQSLTPYKIWRFPLDGYDVITYFTKTFTADCKIYSLQVWSEDFILLPFHISVKVAKIFLKDNNLSLFQMKNMDKFLYCWTKMTTLDNEMLKPMDNFAEERSYGDLTYYFIKEEFVL